MCPDSQYLFQDADLGDDLKQPLTTLFAETLFWDTVLHK